MATMMQQEDSKGGRGAVIAVAILVIAAVAALGGRRYGWFGGGSAPAGANPAAAGQMPPMPVDVDTARRGNVVDAVRASGHIEAVQSVDLRPDEEGRILKLLFEEGQTVDSGAPLIQIDDAVLRAQVERATADRDLAKQQLARVQRLKADNAAAPADVERAEAAARSSEAALGVLQLQVDRSTVRAPFAGVVGQRFVSAGDYVTTSTKLLTLQTTDPQRAVIEVPERYATQLRNGQTVEFRIAAQPDKVFRAQVEFIDPSVQASSRTIIVKARAPNPGKVLKAGMFIEARLATTTRPNAIIVPEDAIQPLRSANIAWAVVDGKAARRVVTLGTRSEGVVEITDGVKAGDVVVVGGLERMAEGMPVAPRPRQKGAPVEGSAVPPMAPGAP